MNPTSLSVHLSKYIQKPLFLRLFVFKCEEARMKLSCRKTSGESCVPPPHPCPHHHFVSFISPFCCPSFVVCRPWLSSVSLQWALIRHDDTDIFWLKSCLLTWPHYCRAFIFLFFVLLALLSPCQQSHRLRRLFWSPTLMKPLKVKIFCTFFVTGTSVLLLSSRSQCISLIV